MQGPQPALSLLHPLDGFLLHFVKKQSRMDAIGV
jgi:hypothetical protein